LTLVAMGAAGTVAAGAVDVSLGKTVVDLVSLGFLGFAAATSLIGAVVIMNNRKASAAQMKTGRLWLALTFANVVIGACLHMWDTRQGGSVIVNFSPRIADEALPAPYILVGVEKWGEGQIIDIRRDRQMIVYVEAIEHMKKKSAAQEQTIAQMVAQLTSRGDVAPIDDAGQ
jgi:hypothetical protein